MRQYSRSPAHFFHPNLLWLGIILFIFGNGTIDAERLPLKTYTTAEGLAHNVINKIVRDSRGFLWFCTGEGLSRFDGYTFTNYGTQQGLPSSVINDLLETRDGEYWLATNGGLVKFDPKGAPSGQVTYSGQAQSAKPMFTIVEPDDQDRRAKVISVLLAGREGTLWCGTYKGLYRLDRSNRLPHMRLEDVGILSQYPEQSIVNDLLEDGNGSLWIATPSGLYRRWSSGRAARYTKQDGLPDEYFHDLFMDHQGRLWAGTRYGGFFRFDADGSQSPPKFVLGFNKNNGLPTGWVFQIFETSDLRFWLATARGLIEYFPDAKASEPRFHVYNEANGLSYHDITSLGEDIAGNLWLGSYMGVMKLAHNGFITYDAQDGLLAVNAIFSDEEGGICFRARVNGDGTTSVFEGAKLDLLHPTGEQVMRLGRFDGQTFNWFLPEVLKRKIDYGWVGEGITLQSQAGEWWIGTGAGLCRFARADALTQIKGAAPKKIYTVKDGLGGAQVYRLFEDSRGDIWISTVAKPNGLALWDHVTETIHDLGNVPGLPSLKDELPGSFGEDRAGNVWIGFGTGIARYHDGRVNFFGTGDGLTAGAIHNIYRDRSERLWLASARGGLVRVDQPESEHPTFYSFATTQGLSSDNAEVITEDLQGKLYIGTGRGLDRLDPTTGGVEHFTTADGLVAGEFLSASRDRQGEVWFGTQKGMSRLMPKRQQAMAAPPVWIAGLQVAGTPQIVSALGESIVQLPSLDSSQNQLDIDFLALGFQSGEILRYQYKLEGADQDWGRPTTERRVNYARLAAGHYRFLVRAINSDGVISANPAVVAFTIVAPVWQRWWFLLMTVIVMAAIVYLLFRYRVRQILQLANIRTRIAADLHDDIGSNLTRISILSEVAHSQLRHESREVVSPLESIAEISRESVSSMGDIVWAINPKRDSYFDLVQRMRRFATELLSSHGIEFQFQASEVSHDFKLGANIRRDVYLFFKESLNNAGPSFRLSERPD